MRLLAAHVGAPRKRAKRKIKKDIQKELWGWGDWRNAGQCKGLSYSACSTEGRMMLFGTYLPTAFLCIVPEYYPKPKILDLDRKIKRLPEHDKSLLAYRYIAGASFDDIGFYCKITIREVGEELDRIEDSLDGSIK